MIVDDGRERVEGREELLLGFFFVPQSRGCRCKVNQDGMYSIWKVQVRICSLVKDVDVRYFLA